jgi:hypothetical protein
MSDPRPALPGSPPWLPTWRELEQLKRLAWATALVLEIFGPCVVETRRVQR